MQYGEFIQKVQERGAFENREEAERVAFAVLGTLGEKIYRTEERQLAAVNYPKNLDNSLPDAHLVSAGFSHHHPSFSSPFWRAVWMRS